MPLQKNRPESRREPHCTTAQLIKDEEQPLQVAGSLHDLQDSQ
jgi:hypothetical protein